MRGDITNKTLLETTAIANEFKRPIALERDGNGVVWIIEA